MTRQIRFRSWLSALLAMGLISAFLSSPLLQNRAEAASPSSRDGTGIAVSGAGAIWVTPDIARLSLGVSVTSTTVSNARAGAAAAMQSVQNAVLAAGVRKSDIQTQYFSVSPQYSYNNPGAPTISGYTVSNQVEVTVRNIDTTSDVVDSAVAAGGNAVRVNGTTFTVDQPEPFMAQARAVAVKDAFARASELAAAAGVSVGRPRSIVESGGNVPFPVAPAAPSASGVGAPTPINPGLQQIQISVSIVYEII